MPSPTLQRYRQALAEVGATDDRDDDFIIAELGQEAERTNPTVFDSDPEFAQRYRGIREANAPSMGGEVTRGLKRGGLGLLSTGAGGLSLFTGDGWLRNKARELEQAAGDPELRSTIPDLESIAPGEQSTTAKVFSRDALRYAAAKFGEAAPSIVEAVGTGIAGAVAGSAAAPGPGTIAGAAGGFLGRSMVRKAIRELVEKGVKDLTPEIVAVAARQVGARAGGTAVAAVNSYVLNAGDVLSEIPENPALAAGIGIISAIPDTILPALIVRRLFPGVQVAAAKEAAKEMVADRAMELGKKLGLAAGAVAGEGATEWFQEGVNIVARNIEHGIDPLTVTDADLKRMREAGITGFAGGLIAAPAVALGGKPTKLTTDTPGAPPAPLEPDAVEPPATPRAPLRTNAQTVGQIELMTAEEKLARITELQAKGALAADEQIELELLLAEPPVAPPAAAVITPPPAPVIPAPPVGAPPSIGLPGQEIESPDTPAQPAPGLVEAPTPEADYERYEEIQRLWAELRANGVTADAPVIQELWRENEEIKNRYGGMPPTAPEIVAPPTPAVSNPQLFAPAQGSENLVPPGEPPAIGLPGQEIEEPDAPPVAPPADQAPQFTARQIASQRKIVAHLKATKKPEELAAAEAKLETMLANKKTEFSRAQIVEQRRVVKQIEADLTKATETNPKRAKKLAGQLDKARVTLADMEENKFTAPAPSVGNRPDGEPDILTTIAEKFGKIRTIAPAEGTSAKGGEYNGWDSALAYGAARLLNGGENGMQPDDIVEFLNSEGYRVGSIGEAQELISRASEKRKQMGAAIDPISDPLKYQEKVETAFTANKGRDAKLKPKDGIPIEAIGVGGKFQIDDEGFSIVDIIDAEDNAEGITYYIVKDGHKFRVQEGELVFPDKGSLKKAKRGKVSFGEEDTPLTPENAPKPEDVKPIVPSTAITPPSVTPKDQQIDKQADDAKKILDEKAAAFTYGRIIEGLPTIDFRQTPEIVPTTTVDWVRVLKANVKEGNQGDEGGNRALTRIALLMQGPEQQLLLSGMVSPQFTLRADGTREVAGLSLQQMGEGNKQRLVKDGGEHPALLSEVLDAGWKPLAVIHFDGQPSRIFQRFTGLNDFDAAYGATEKTAATEGTLSAPNLQGEQRRARDNAKELEKQIDELRALWEKETDGAAKKKLEERLAALYPRYIAATERGQDQSGTQGPQLRVQPAQIGTPEFKAWFGDSKVVDATGKPVAVYHGTSKDFTAFDATHATKGSMHPTAEAGFFFSADPSVASDFSGQEWDMRTWPATTGYKTGASVIPAYLKISNPRVITAREFMERFVRARFYRDGKESFTDWARAEGHDGVLIKADPALAESLSGDEYKADTWIAFQPTQIKSATANNGSFDSTNPDIRFRTPEIQNAQRLPLDAARAQQFQQVVQRLRAMGANVDLFAREFFAQGVAAEIQAKIAALEQQLAGAGPAVVNQLNRRIIQLRARLGEVGQARGAAFSPFHMAIAMDDVMNADPGNLVTLLHEAAESLAMRLSLPMRGALTRAIDESMADLRKQAAESEAKTGVTLALETGAIDRLAETLAQKMAAEGIPDAPSLVDAIIRWVKDLYYRTLMAVQRAFGAEPDGQVALDWFENQLRRITGGDYDYRFAHLLDRYLPPSLPERVRSFAGRGTTPGALADYFNPFSNKIEQPSVLSDSGDALLWNVEYQTGGLAVPDPEARARQHVAAINRVRAKMEKVYADSKSSLPWEEWWQLVGSGEDPKTIPSWIEQRYPGISGQQIGGDRMTKVTDGLAALEARSWLEKIATNAQSKLAKANETIEATADEVVNASREVNEIEGDRRNAQLQSATLEKKLKELIKRFVEDYKNGLTGSVEMGRLAEAVRQADELMDGDPVPANYQKVFKSILDGQTPIFDYIKAIAELELPYSDMTGKEVIRAIRDNGDANATLKTLAGNKPLLVALATLAKANSAQMDDIRMALLKNTEQYSKLHAELEKIRQASDAELQEMFKTVEEQQKAATFGERIKQQYIKRRRALRTARDRIKRATDRAGAIESAQVGIAEAVEESQIEGGTAPSEWMPVDGAEWKEMVPDKDDENAPWTARKRTLKFNADGTAADADGIYRALANNKVWLDNNVAKAGGRNWQEVYRQTTELNAKDLKRASVAVHWHKMFQWSAPLISDLRRMGGAEGAEGAKMMNNFEFIIQSNRQAVATISRKWSSAWQDVQKAAGIPDNGELHERIYDPVSYFLNTNPGLDEDAALRQATKMARDRLTKPPGPNFEGAMYALLRETKAGFEYLVGLGEKHGVFIKDERLKSELRNAVARGWLTSMRSMDAAVVNNLTTNMQKAGWKLEMREDPRGRKAPVKAVTFEDLTTAETAEDQTETLDEALRPLFTPGIKRDWLLPFINKGGVEILKWDEAPIAQLDLQTAWANANGNILRWIDNLADVIDLQPLTGPEGEEVEALPVFRLSVLRQLDRLFGMESKLAAEASESKDLFDPLGPKPHVMLDARVNDLLPPEHLNFALLDDQSARIMLSHIAFHGAFGRNGERMATTLRNMTSKVKAKAARYQLLTGTTRGVRLSEALAKGWDFKELEAAATKVDELGRLDSVLRQFMSVGTAGGPFQEAHAMMELLNFMAGQIIDNPKTGFYDVLSLAERPLTMRSLGPATVKATARSIGTAAKTAMGSILEAMHIHLFHASQQALETTNAIAGARNLPWKQAIADIGPYGRQDRIDRYFFKPLQLTRFIQNKGLAFPGQGQAKEFPRAALIPGLGINSWMGQSASVGGMAGQFGMLEDMVRHGHRYFSNHKDAAQDPTFRFKARDLGLGRWDTGVFDWWQAKTPEFGLGTLENIVRDSMAAAAKGERLFSKDQVMRLTQMYSQELAGQSSTNTMPSILLTNPILRLAFPLLRWPFWAMHHVHEGMTTQDGRKSLASVSRGLATLALWNLPLGLAFTLLLDRYDEDALGKKSNLPPVGKTAAIPVVGPFAEAVMADRSIPDTLKAYLVRMARAGNIGGLAADFAGQVAAPTDSASGRRVFSLDQRVLVMSQLLNAQQALTNAMNQGWTATWASVWAPLMRSVGGNAALHSLDVANNILGLDNAESRLVMRINATSWLRSAAGELDVPLRHGGMGTPTPMSVHTREMLHSAMAGDRVGFMESYRKAKEAAMKAVGQDPGVPASKRDDEAEQRVLAGWRGRDPLSIFAHRPTDAQLNRLLSIMDDDGRVDVRSALQRYDQFTQMIKPSAFERAMNQRMNRMLAPPRMAMPRVGSLF